MVPGLSADEGKMQPRAEARISGVLFCTQFITTAVRPTAWWCICPARTQPWHRYPFLRAYLGQTLILKTTSKHGQCESL